MPYLFCGTRCGEEPREKRAMTRRPKRRKIGKGLAVVVLEGKKFYRKRGI